MKQTPPPPTPATPEQPAAEGQSPSLIPYPCLFPIKVMGLKNDELVGAISWIARRFDPDFDASSIEVRQSKAGNYQGVTINVMATSRQQLDELYRSLSTHPLVKVVL